MELTNDWDKVQELAQIGLDNLETKQRTQTGEDFICCKDGAPQWLQDMCRAAHGEMLGDDYKYRFLQDSLERITDHDSEEELQDNRPESDIYNFDLLKWISSDLHRAGYVDDALSEFGLQELFPALMCGQIAEKEEVESAVISFLQNPNTDDAS